MTLFEALTGGAFDRLPGNIAGNLTKIFLKSQMPRGLPGGGGMGGFGIDRYIRTALYVPFVALFWPLELSQSGFLFFTFLSFVCLIDSIAL